MLMDRQTDKKQTNKRTELHQFRKEPSYDGDLSPCQIFELESGNRNFDSQTDKKWTNERTKLHQFRKEPSCDGDLCPCQVSIRSDKAFLS